VNFELVFDPLFRTPFAVGLIMSAILPLLGNLLRLRDEWLAALGLAYLAGASGLVGLAVGIPAVLGAPLGALAGATIKAFGQFRGNTVYAMMVVIGWAATMLVAANTSLGSVVGHALVEGQLYFAGNIHLVAAATVGVLSAIAIPVLMPTLVRSRLLPGHEVSNQRAAWRWHLGFDMLAALGMAIGAGTLGLMGAFALAFVPPWAAFRIARNWRHCQWISVGIGVFAYVLAFVIALSFDQPFGPVLVAVLIVSTGAILLVRSY
jgi:zinc/manganese transport system permease protein